MQRLQLDTTQVRAVEGFDCWRETMANLIGVASDPLPDRTMAGFQARMDVIVTPPLTYIDFAATNSRVARSRSQIRDRGWGCYWIYREMGAGAWFEFTGRRELTTRTGDLIIADADMAFETRADRDYQHHIWMLPYASVDPHLPPLPRPLLVHVPAASGLSALVTAYIDALAGQLAGLTSIQAVLVADNLCRLVAIACGAAEGGHAPTMKTARLEQARRHIELHLASPDLDPESVAAALGTSLRQLHLAFEPSGESFSQYVRRRRLQECRSTLENPLSLHRSITDIAFGWGFASLPTFYRAFQAAFGIAPGDVRARALDRRYLP